MVSCAIIGCKSTAGKHKGVRFFGIPTVITHHCNKTQEYSQRRRSEWIARINRKGITENNIRRHHKVCSKHFLQGHPSGLFDSDSQDWAPSIHLDYGNPASNVCDSTGDSDSPTEDPLVDTTEVMDVKEEKPASSPYSVPLSCDVPQGYSAEAVNLEVKVEYPTCDLVPNVMDISFNSDYQMTDISVQVDPHVTNGAVQACPEVKDASVQGRLCCDEVDSLRQEREALVQDTVCLNSGLGESAYEMQSFDSSSVEKNFILAEKNIKINELQAKMRTLQAAHLSLIKTNNELKSSISKVVLNKDSLKNDDKKVLYYTGLPTYDQLTTVYNLVCDKVKDSGAYQLTKFEQFIMVLAWLRLGLEEQDLSYRFGVNLSTTGRIIDRWVVPMSNALEKLISQPNRETLQKNVSPNIQENKDTGIAVIVDCFEVARRQHLSLLARGETWRQNEKHKSVKFCMVTTLHGKVLFLSKAWVGSESSKHVIEHCGSLDRLLPGDIVMVEQGFTNSDSLGIMPATLAVSEGKAELLFNDSELTQKTASVEIDAEKGMGLVRRKYQILSSTIPVRFLTKKKGHDLAPIDHVVRVCCALTNQSLSVD